MREVGVPRRSSSAGWVRVVTNHRRHQRIVAREGDRAAADELNRLFQGVERGANQRSYNGGVFRLHSLDKFPRVAPVLRRDPSGVSLQKLVVCVNAAQSANTWLMWTRP